jgi:cell division FtsZ-interacting protein ZapD
MQHDAFMMEMVQPFTQFGVAGLMGALWVWERLHSRRRERQLTESHDHLTGQQQHLKVLIRLVRRNTQALERFSEAQQRLNDLLEKVQHAINTRAR